MNNIKCLDERKQLLLSMFSFKMPVVGRKIIVISICFSYSKCLRVIELEADENIHILN